MTVIPCLHGSTSRLVHNDVQTKTSARIEFGSIRATFGAQEVFTGDLARMASHRHGDLFCVVLSGPSEVGYH